MTATLRALFRVCDILIRRLVRCLLDALDLALGGGDVLLCSVDHEEIGDRVAVGADGFFDIAGVVVQFRVQVVLKGVIGLTRQEVHHLPECGPSWNSFTSHALPN